MECILFSQQYQPRFLKVFVNLHAFYMMLATISKLEILSLKFVKDNSLLTYNFFLW